MKAVLLSVVLASVALCACSSIKQTPAQAFAPTTKTIKKTSTFESRYGFDETLTRLKQALEEKGMTVFAQVDHKAAAQGVGLDMQPATVIIFGTPKAGTPLMIKDPSFALQLPLKVLVTQVSGKTQVIINDTGALIEGSRIEYDEVKNTLKNAEILIEKTVTQ